MNLIKRIKKQLHSKPLLFKPDINYKFNIDETVIFNDGYNKYKVMIQGISQDVVTIAYGDGLKLDTHIKNLSKI